jgi:hypothetical protein
MKDIDEIDSKKIAVGDKITMKIKSEYNGKKITGYTEGSIKDIKNEFAVIEYFSNYNQRATKILHLNSLRIENNLMRTKLSLSDTSMQPLQFSLDTINNNPRPYQTIFHFIKNIKNLHIIKLAFYAPSQNKLFIFDEKVDEILLNKAIQTLKDHIQVISTSKLKFSDNPKSPKIEQQLQKSIEVDKILLELIKPKIELFKKQKNVKIEIKNVKNPNLVKIDFKAQDMTLFKAMESEFNISQIFLSLNLSEKDEFFKSNSGLSLKTYSEQFYLNSYHVYKIDEESVSVKLIGKENDVELISKLIKCYEETQIKLKIRKQELESLNKNNYL